MQSAAAIKRRDHRHAVLSCDERLDVRPSQCGEAQVAPGALRHHDVVHIRTQSIQMHWMVSVFCHRPRHATPAQISQPFPQLPLGRKPSKAQRHGPTSPPSACSHAEPQSIVTPDELSDRALTDRAERSGQKIVHQCQFTDLGGHRLHVDRRLRRFGRAVRAENASVIDFARLVAPRRALRLIGKNNGLMLIIAQFLKISNYRQTIWKHCRARRQQQLWRPPPVQCLRPR